MKVAVLVLCFVGLAFSKVTLPEDIEDWGLEHPRYNLTDNQPKDRSYEIRTYESAKWVSTTVRSVSEDLAKMEGFKRLYHYIRGGNDRGIEIDMTVPVLTKVQANPCVFCPSNYSVSFYIPSIYQANPPKPTDKDVFIMSRPVTTFFVRYFGGEAFPEWSKVEAFRLARDLYRNNVTETDVTSDWMLVAEYDSPMRRRHRHNEIWLEVREGTEYGIDYQFGVNEELYFD